MPDIPVFSQASHASSHTTEDRSYKDIKIKEETPSEADFASDRSTPPIVVSKQADAAAADEGDDDGPCTRAFLACVGNAYNVTLDVIFRLEVEDPVALVALNDAFKKLGASCLALEKLVRRSEEEKLARE